MMVQNSYKKSRFEVELPFFFNLHILFCLVFLNFATCHEHGAKIII